jgi:TP901 family phage tail tape measure protein
MAQGNNQLQVNVVANVRAAQAAINKLAAKPVNLTINSKQFSQPLGRIQGQLGEFEKSLEASNARVIAFGASASAIFAVQKALSESVKSAIEVEKALKDINVILNLTDQSLSQFGTSLFDIAKNTGNAFSTVATAATELSRQGLGVAETLKRTEDALILTRLSGLGAAESVEAITATLNGFQKAALSSTDVINKLAAVDANFAVSSGDLAEAIKRVGSSAEDAGVSFDQLLAIVTSAQQITARGGSVIGNSFKTIFTRLQRPKVLEDLQQLGIQTQTAEGNTRPLIDILSELAKTFDNLNDSQKAAIAEQVGGVFQINILKAALGDLNKEYSIFSNALKTSTGATDEAIRRNEALNTTLASLINKTLANLTAAGAKIGELSLAPALKKVFGGLNTVLEG